MMNAYSIVIRLRRITTEHVHVSVPMTDAITKPEPEADGTYRIDTDALVAEAKRLAQDPKTPWSLDGEPEIGPHPIQTPPPGLMPSD